MLPLKKHDRYKEKECPKCGILHKKEGPYCSQSCSSQRQMAEHQKKSISKSNKRYYSETIEGYASRKRTGDMARSREKYKEMGLSDEDWMLDFPLTTDNLDIYDDDTDIWR